MKWSLRLYLRGWALSIPALLVLHSSLTFAAAGDFDDSNEGQMDAGVPSAFLQKGYEGYKDFLSQNGASEVLAQFGADEARTNLTSVLRFGTSQEVDLVFGTGGVNTSMNRTLKDVMHPLGVAAAACNFPVVSSLIALGADVEATQTVAVSSGILSPLSLKTSKAVDLARKTLEKQHQVLEQVSNEKALGERELARTIQIHSERLRRCENTIAILQIAVSKAVIDDTATLGAWFF